MGAELRDMLGSPLAELQCVGAACLTLLLRSSFAWTGAVFNGHEGPLSETFAQIMQVGFAALPQEAAHQLHEPPQPTVCGRQPFALLCQADYPFFTPLRPQQAALLSCLL